MINEKFFEKEVAIMKRSVVAARYSISLLATLVAVILLANLLSPGVAKAYDYFIEAAGWATTFDGNHKDKLDNQYLVNAETFFTWSGHIDGSGFDASVSITADIATGTLKAFATATGTSSATAYIRFGDIIFLHWPEGLTESFPVTISYDVKGTFTGYSTGLISRVQAKKGGIYGSWDYIDSLTDGESHWTETLSINPQNPLEGILAVCASMELNSVSYGTADFSDSGIFSLTLPEDVTFTSQSGVFLTVPIPGAFWLLGSGLLGLAGLRKLKKS